MNTFTPITLNKEEWNSFYYRVTHENTEVREKKRAFIQDINDTLSITHVASSSIVESSDIDERTVREKIERLSEKRKLQKRRNLTVDKQHISTHSVFISSWGKDASSSDYSISITNKKTEVECQVAVSCNYAISA